MKNLFKSSGIILLILSVFLIFSCKKEKPGPPHPTDEIIFNPDLTYGTVTDIDGNTYKTITIGTQTWMAENLKTTKYNNGDPIGTTTPATLDYRSEDSPKYQWEYNGYKNYSSIYGRLYTWYAVNDSRHVCPEGWHIPVNSEWSTLTDFLGGTVVADSKLKESGTNHWYSNDPRYSVSYPGSNQSGFTALPGGSNAFGWYFGVGVNASFWSASESTYTGYAWDMELALDSFSTYMNDNLLKAAGISVRCLHDF